jgi:hypothetical protein
MALFVKIECANRGPAYVNLELAHSIVLGAAQCEIRFSEHESFFIAESDSQRVIELAEKLTGRSGIR